MDNGLGLPDTYSARMRTERDAAIARAEIAEAALAKRDEPCIWVFDGDTSDYVAGCNDDWFDNSVKFCPNCGHPVVLAPF